MCDGFDWMDLALAGSLAEEMAEEERERLREEREADAEEDCCCADDPEPYEPPDEDPCP